MDYNNLELQILHMIHHTDVCKLKHYCYSSGDMPDVGPKFVLKYTFETVYRDFEAKFESQITNSKNVHRSSRLSAAMTIGLYLLYRHYSMLHQTPIRSTESKYPGFEIVRI